MSKQSATKTLTAILSVATLGLARSLGMGTVRAEEKQKDKNVNNVTEEQILRALAPEKKPLTRGLSVGPQQQVDPATAAAESKLVQKVRGRATRSLSVSEREEIAARVASFKAMQKKFERERHEYYATTLGNAWDGFTPRSQ